MAEHSVKRRKLAHVESSDEGDDVSFASSGDGDGIEPSGSESASEDGTDTSMDDDAEISDEDDVEDDAENQGIDAKVIAEPKKLPNKAQTSRAGAGVSAYTNGTFKSTIFKLQVDELLEGIQPRRGSRETGAEAALHKLKTSIEQIPARGPYSLQEAEKSLTKEKVTIPFPSPGPPKDARYKFAYAKPANVNVIGSFALKTASRARGGLEVDMIVTIPNVLFEEKDFLNHRYFYKRAFYLACIAASLRKGHHAEFDMSFKLLHDDALKPILSVTPRSKDTEGKSSSATQWRINIIPCVSQDVFRADKLNPDKNCVRGLVADKATGKDATPEPTPFYNSSIRNDMLFTTYLQALHRAKKGCEAYTDACLLGGTWLRQRGMGSSVAAGGFGNFEWSALIAICIQGGMPGGKPLLNEGYSSYQLFKAAIQLLAIKDLTKDPLVIGSGASAFPPGNGSPIIWDADRAHNLLFKMSTSSYKMLRHEAKLTLKALNDQLYDGFDATFILKTDQAMQRFDCSVQVSQQALSQIKTSQPHNAQVTASRLYHILKRGLRDRVEQIFISSHPSSGWQLDSKQPSSGKKDFVTIGFLVNPDTVKRLVDHGPSAENKAEAASFRSFWGEKAELRRFKDGSILESLVWTQSSEKTVLEQIVRYLLQRHFSVSAIEYVRFFGDGFESLVRGGSDLVSFSHMQADYKRFEDDIRNLSDPPLTIRQIMPADAQLRYTSARPPRGGKSASRIKPASVVVQFEGTNRWPDDLVAIQKTKIAFLLNLSELLQSSVAGISTRVGLENEEHEVLNQGYLDVTYGSDTTFRLRIHHERDQSLYERQLKDKSISSRTREIAAIGLTAYKREYIKNPAHTQAMARLCVRFPILSGTIRLTKRWFASHLLANHFPEEVIELLVARTFMQPWPWQTAASVQTGFLRTLSWIARWDWRTEPLIVDLSGSGDLKRGQMQDITTRFEAWRKLDPILNRVAIFAASNVDPDGTTWTDGQPTKVVAGRMTALAKAACAEMAEKQLQLDPASLFSSSLEDFDFVIHLSGKATGRRGQDGTMYKNLELEATGDESLIGYDPVASHLHELENIYSSAVLFFSGGEERGIIAGLWSPLTARRAWRVNLAYSTIPTAAAGDPQADLNRTAILAEMARLGGDLVEKVEVIKH